MGERETEGISRQCQSVTAVRLEDCVTRTRHDLRLENPDVCERPGEGLLAITSTTIIKTHKHTVSTPHPISPSMRFDVQHSSQPVAAGDEQLQASRSFPTGRQTANRTLSFP